MRERRLFLVLVDVLLINAAVVLAFAVWSARGDIAFSVLLSEQTHWFVILSALWLAFEFSSGLYDLSVVIQFEATVRGLVQTFTLAVITYLVLFFFVPTELPRGIVVYHGVAAVGLIGLWRGIYVRFAPLAPFRRRALIVGAGRSGQTIAATIQSEFHPHYDLVGFIDDDSAKRVIPLCNLNVLGGQTELLSIVRQHRVEEIILAITHGLSEGLFRAILDAKEIGVKVTPMPVLFEQITGRVPVEYVGDSWYVALPLDNASTSGLSSVIKRAFDIVAASFGLLLFGVMLPFIALAIRLDSRGSIFYAQARVGQGGKIFTVNKLRTMVTDAEQAGRAVWASKNDPRITRVGKILRKTHLDELPQLWNILRGEMSVVGPRPERPEFVAQLEKQIPFYRLRHSVKPGMAGWALTKAGYVDSLEDARLRTEYDLYYIKHQSFGFDLWILFRTVGQVLMFRGQ